LVAVIPSHWRITMVKNLLNYLGMDDYLRPGGAYAIQEYAEDDYLIWSDAPTCMGNEWLFRCKIYRQDSVQLQIVKLNFGQPVYPQDTCFVTLVH